MPQRKLRLSSVLFSIIGLPSLVVAFQNATPDAQKPQAAHISAQEQNPPLTSSKAAQSAPNQEPPDLISIDKKQGSQTGAWALLAWGLSSNKVRDRSDAISGLTVLDANREAITLIAKTLKDKEEDIRYLAATSLGNMKARPAIPDLRAALDDQSTRVSFAAAQSLWKMNDRSGRYVIYAVMDGERKPSPGLLQSKVKDAKRTMHDPKAMALLGVNEVSGTFLGPFSMGISMAEEYAKNNSAPVQALCAQLLSNDDSQLTVLELRSALDDKNWPVRAAAARSLAKLRDTASIPRVQDMMESDKSQSARFVAAASMILFNDHGAATASRDHRKGAKATAAAKSSSNKESGKQQSAPTPQVGK